MDMSFRALCFVAAGALGAAVFACSSDPDSGDPVPTEPTCEGTATAAFRFPNGTDGSPDPFGAKAAGQARAGRIRDASQIVQNENARHKVRPGDFVLANDRIAVYVEAEGPSDGYDPFGGEILALEPVGPDGRPTGVSQYNETLVMLSRQTVQPDKVSVIADGSDGKAAIVRASGKLSSIPFLDTFRTLIPDEYDFPAALDYVLEPGATRVTLRLHLLNTRTEAVDFQNKQFFGFFHSSRSQAFTEPFGFGEPKGEVPWVAFASPLTGGAFLYRSLSGPIRTEIGLSGFQMFSTNGLAVDACATKTVDYAEVVVGGPGLDGVLEAKRAALGEAAWREVRGTVKETDGAPVPNALVHATAPDGRYLTRVTADANGAYVLHVPQGDAQVTATAKGWAIQPATLAPAAASNVDVVLPKRAILEVTSEDATTKELIPTRVQVIPSAAIARAPAAFGVTDDEPNGRLWQEFSTSGKIALPVPPGQHRVIVTRGYEYELYDAPAAAEAGKTTAITASLLRSVDSTGVMCADFHIHSHYSADSDDLPELKVKGAIADGLEVPVSSEHEWVIDFQPIIQRLGLAKWAFGFSSEELTTFTWGHFGVVPLMPRPDAVNNGAVDWVGKKPAEFFRTVNELPEKPVLIVNHPTSQGFQGYFAQAQFDRAKASGDPELWSDQFGAIEVFNDSDYDSNRGSSVGDWYALLDAGKTFWAVGNSDSHRERTSPVGYPRTCLRFGHDDPTKLSAEIVRDVLRAGAAVVSGGLTMTVQGPGGIGPGGTAARGPYQVSIACPSWLSATELEVIVDGKPTQTLPLTPTADPGPGKKYAVTVDVQPSESRARHYVVFHARGKGAGADGDLSPLHPGRKPFAASNPIFFGP